MVQVESLLCFPKDLLSTIVLFTSYSLTRLALNLPSPGAGLSVFRPLFSSAALCSGLAMAGSLLMLWCRFSHVSLVYFLLSLTSKVLCISISLIILTPFLHGLCRNHVYFCICSLLSIILPPGGHSLTLF